MDNSESHNIETNEDDLQNPLLPQPPEEIKQSPQPKQPQSNKNLTIQGKEDLRVQQNNTDIEFESDLLDFLKITNYIQKQLNKINDAYKDLQIHLPVIDKAFQNIVTLGKKELTDELESFALKAIDLIRESQDQVGSIRTNLTDFARLNTRIDNKLSSYHQQMIQLTGSQKDKFEFLLQQKVQNARNMTFVGSMRGSRSQTEFKKGGHGFDFENVPDQLPEPRTNRLTSLLGFDAVQKLSQFKQRQTEVKKMNPTQQMQTALRKKVERIQEVEEQKEFDWEENSKELSEQLKTIAMDMSRSKRIDAILFKAVNCYQLEIKPFGLVQPKNGNVYLQNSARQVLVMDSAAQKENERFETDKIEFKFGIVVDEQLWAVVNKFIYIFDLDTRMKVRIIEAFKVITKIALLDDLVCIGCDQGFIELISPINHTFLLTNQIRTKQTVREIQSTLNRNIYALSTQQGFFLFIIQQMSESKFLIWESSEMYFQGRDVRSAVEYDNDKFLVFTGKDKFFTIFNRKTNEMVQKITNPSNDSWVWSTKLIYTHETSKKFPIVVIRDSKQVSLISTRTMKVFLLAETPLLYTNIDINTGLEIMEDKQTKSQKIYVLENQKKQKFSSVLVFELKQGLVDALNFKY